MNRSQFLRLSTFGTLGFASRGLALPTSYAGAPSGLRPYLQSPRPDSIWVSWFSDKAPSGVIEWGTSPTALTHKVETGLDTLGPGFNYHSGKITGLSPRTYYYYRIRNEAAVSETFRFRTLPATGTKTGKFRVLVMGDNQIIKEDRYARLVACAKAKIESAYRVPIEEAIDFILMPGDMVDVGTLDHYRNLHFKQCGLVSPNLPIMTTIGNHETYYDKGMDLYKRIFRYEDLNYGGITSPGGNLYYSYKFANIAFIHTSSEHTGPEQKDWCRKLVDTLKTDTTTDLCVSVCHRPYQAEQYVGDISSWFRNEIMPMMAETEKHVLNIGAHHHLYARGQTREWPVYHIISGGTAWDQFWGTSKEVDFDDVQKTIANWAWQILDFDLAERSMQVTCFAEANVKLPAATRWNYNSRIIDSFHRKLGLAVPAQPAVTNVFTAPVTLPLALKSSAYKTSTTEKLNSTWFQIATDPAFTNLKIDKIRDYENFYGDTGAPLYEPIDINKGIDLLQFPIAADSLPNGTYHVRLRHRDANASWSPWSVSVPFEVTGSVVRNPVISLTQHVYPLGGSIPILYENGPGNAKDWIGIFKKGQTPSTSSKATTWQYLKGKSGTLTFAADKLAAGQEWFASLLADDGYTEVSNRVPFYIGNTPTLSTDKAAYDQGDTVRIAWSNALPGPSDTVRLYKAGQAPGSNPAIASQAVTTPSGTATFEKLPKGYYYAVYLVSDGSFEVSPHVPFAVGSQIATVSMPSDVITAGQDFIVNFTDGPGIPKDYIGLFKQGDVPGVNVLISYLYFDGKSSGSVTFKLPDLPPGDYFAALYSNDSYTAVSNHCNFTAKAR